MKRPPTVPAPAVVFCQHGLADPLVGTLILDYIMRLRSRGDLGECLLFTEEPPGAIVAPDQGGHLARTGIHWAPQRYDLGGAQWWQRSRNILRMLRTARRFVRRNGPCWMIGFLSYGGSYALLAQWIGLGPAMVVCFEPHSRYMVEMGIWRKHSLKAWVTGWLERMQMRRCHALIVPTHAVRELVEAHHPRGRVVQQPITIDVDAARFDPQARARLRARYGLDDALVIVYVGKFGGIYHSVGAYMDLMQGLLEASDRFRACIIASAADLALVRAHPVTARYSGRIVLQDPVPPAELAAHLSAADIGVVAIPPSPAQAYRTPVKSAHYWAAGLPILIAEGVSDDHRIASEEGGGVVVKDLGSADRTDLARRIEELFSGDRDLLRQRCMAIARRHRDTSLMIDRLRSLLR